MLIKITGASVKFIGSKYVQESFMSHIVKATELKLFVKFHDE